MKAKRLSGGGGQSAQWQDCTILLTVDKNIFVVEGHDSYYRVPTVRFRVYKGCSFYNGEAKQLSLFERQNKMFCLRRNVQHTFAGGAEELLSLHEILKNN